MKVVDPLNLGDYVRMSQDGIYHCNRLQAQAVYAGTIDGKPCFDGIHNYGILEHDEILHWYPKRPYWEK